MKVVLTSATANEWKLVNEQINPLYTGESIFMQVSFHVSGVGILSSTFKLSQLILEQQPDLVIQLGIAGSFDRKRKLGEVVIVSDEYIGDLGVEENGSFKDVFDLKLQKSNEAPFKNKMLSNPWLDQFNLLKLKAVTAVTVNEVTTRNERIAQLEKKYAPAIESMEGAALHYVCKQTHTPFIQMRAISNYIGERDKQRWDIKGALGNLSAATLRYLDKLYKQK